MSLGPFSRKTRGQTAKSSLLNVATKENLYKPILSQTKNHVKKDVGLPQVSEKNDKGKIKSDFGLKRKADSEVFIDFKMRRKRAAFGDITNAFEKGLNKKEKSEVKPLSTNRSVSFYCSSIKTESTEKLSMKSTVPHSTIVKSRSKPGSQLDSLDESLIFLSQDLKLDSNKICPEDISSYITASGGSPLEKEDSTIDRQDFQTPASPKLPQDVEDFDKASSGDVHAVSAYAMDIFKYYKARETKLPVNKYISNQPDVTRTMRAILVDWMVEVQESFELNHETLYLAVKLVDLYLSKVVIKRDRLQLVGSTAIFIACKFDERTPPYVDDFLYICDDAYKRKELISLEIHMLKTLDYDLGIPLSYRFLRRFARCGKVGMETLTFARFILELSLMEYDLIETSASVLAASSLFLALNVKEKVSEWSATLTYYSGYNLSDFSPLVHSLHQMILQPPKEHLRTIRNKYSHKVFFEVAKIPMPAHLNL